MASSLLPSPCSLSPSLHPARLNLLHLRRRRRRRRLLICHSCETLRGRKVSPPRCFPFCCSFFLASLESHKIMIGIFAGNLNCLPAFFSSLFFVVLFFLLIICSLVFRHGFLCISCNTFAGILGNKREIPQQEFYSRCSASPSLLSLSLLTLPSPF